LQCRTGSVLVILAQGALPEWGWVAEEQGSDRMSGSAMDLGDDKVMQLLAQAGHLFTKHQ